MPEFYQQFSEVETFNSATDEDKLKFGQIYADQIIKSDERYQTNPELGEFLKTKINEDIQQEFRERPITQQEFFGGVKRTLGEGIGTDIEQLTEGFQRDISAVESRSFGENLGALGQTTADVLLHTVGIPGRVMAGLAQVPHFAVSKALETVGLGDSAANKWVKAQYDGLEWRKNQMNVFNGLVSQYEPGIVTAAAIGTGAGALIHKLTTRTLNTAAMATGTAGFTAADAAIVSGWTAATGEAALVAPATRVIEHRIDESGYSDETKQTWKIIAPIFVGLLSGFTLEHIMDSFMRNPIAVNAGVKGIKAGLTPSELVDDLNKIVEPPSVFDDIVKTSNGRVPQEFTSNYGYKLTTDGQLGVDLRDVEVVLKPKKVVMPVIKKLAPLAKTNEDGVRDLVTQHMDTVKVVKTQMDKLDPVKDKVKLDKKQRLVNQLEEKALKNGIEIQDSGDAGLIKLVDSAILDEPVPKLTRDQALVSDAVDATDSRQVIAEIISRSSDVDGVVSKQKYLENVDNEYRSGGISIEDARIAGALSDDRASGWLYNLDPEDLDIRLKQQVLTGQENSNLGKWHTAFRNNEAGYTTPDFTRQVLIHGLPLITGMETKDGQMSWNVNKYLKYGAVFSALGLSGKVYRKIGVNRIARDVGSKFSRTFWSTIDHPTFNQFTNSLRPGSGLDPKVHEFRKSFKALKSRLKRDADEFAINLSKNFNPEQREMLSDFIEKEGDNWADVPEVIEMQAAKIRGFLGDIRTQLINSGVDEELVSRLGDTYLHRVYVPQLMKKKAYGGVRKAMKAIQGKYLLERGKNANLIKKLEAIGLTQEDFKIGDKVYTFVDAENKKVWAHEAQVDRIAEFGGVENGKAWKITENSSKRLNANTDYTKAERETMGESRDVALRLAVFLRETSHDIALGDLFKNVKTDGQFVKTRAKGQTVKEHTKAAKAEGFVKMPDVVTRSGMNKFGVLNGEWVSPDVKRMLSSMTKKRYESAWEETYKTFLRQALTGWKIAKTAYNPGTHVLNHAANWHITFMSGHNPLTMVPRGISTLATKNRHFIEAVDAGLIDSGIQAGEWNLKNFTNLTKHLDAHESNIPFMMNAMLKSWDLTKGVAKFPLKLYGWGDEIFKLGMFAELRDQGVNPQDALKEANRWFFDYSDVPTGVEFLRDTGIVPFISFTYKIIPAMIRGTIDRPERMLAMMYMYKAVSDLTYEKEFGDKAEAQAKLEAELRPGFQKDQFFGGGPSSQIRLKSDPETGEARTLDVSRYIPGADLFADMGDSFPFGMHPAVSLAYGWESGKHAGFGTNISKYPEPKNEFQEMENFDAQMKFIVNTILPNIPGIPYTYATDRVGNALVATGDINENSGVIWDFAQRRGWNGKNYFGNDVSLGEEVLSSAGIRINRLDVPKAAAQQVQRKSAAFGRATRELNRELNKTRSTPARREAAVEGYKEQIETASEELKTLTTLLQATR